MQTVSIENDSVSKLNLETGMQRSEKLSLRHNIGIKKAIQEQLCVEKPLESFIFMLGLAAF